MILFEISKIAEDFVIDDIQQCQTVFLGCVMCRGFGLDVSEVLAESGDSVSAFICELV